jgi:hypothetical protein
MRERARLIGGNLMVMSEIAGGTTIQVRAPLVTRGVGNVSETSERTAMAPEADEAPSPGTKELPPSTIDAGASSSADAKPTGMQT